MKQRELCLMFAATIALGAASCSSNDDGGGNGSGGNGAGGSAAGGTGSGGKGAGGSAAGGSAAGGSAAGGSAAGGSAAGGSAAGGSGDGGSGAGGSGSGGTGDGGSGAGGSGAGGSGAGGSGTGGGSGSMLSFFVSSSTRTTAVLGGLAGADKICQDLATAVGAGGKTWHAYLSVKGPPVVNARDRIGSGPWFNSKGVMIAKDVADLHTKFGDHTVFIDENGKAINGQWAGSPTPNEHDILTGSNKEGMLIPDNTCADWTMPMGSSAVGHADGLGPGGVMMGGGRDYRIWNYVHTGDCGKTSTGGGAGRIYCFAIN
jgi:hypothetical protein